jgi:hypothetical protein
MGISRSTVCRALVNTEKHLKNNLENVSGFSASQTVDIMKGKKTEQTSGILP